MKGVVPKEQDLHRVLSGLLGKPVTLKRSGIVMPGTPAVVAVYGNANQDVVALGVCELPLSIYLGAALVLMPKDIAAAAVKQSQIEGEILDNFAEVMNVAANLFNQPGAPHVTLQGVHTKAAELPERVVKVLPRPSARIDVEVTVPGYGAGKLNFLAVN